MCGIFGVAALHGRSLSIDERQVRRLCDLLAHRGPDASGYWRRGAVQLAHRRLCVIEPESGANQPMTTEDGRFALVYNGELYNDEQLRKDLAARGAVFRTRCDTETLLLALAHWGMDALPRLRGMFAFALYDTVLNVLTLARDPFGMKPLYFHCGPHEITFASEPAPIVGRPEIGARPNWRMVSAYLTTIRTVLGDETLFEGVHALAPGQAAQCDLGGVAPVVRLIDCWRSPAVGDEGLDETEAARLVRERVEDSIRAHLRSDVPMCALLSGGLDSAIVTSVARRHAPDLRTYCAGAREGVAPAPPDDDLAFAAMASRRFGTRHAEAIVDRDHFRSSWSDMVTRLGVPLSTPNEVAIHAVAMRLRADGCVVTLSGEGADELFAGYEAPLLAAARFIEATSAGDASLTGGAFELRSNAWIHPDAKPGVLGAGAWRAAGADEWLEAFYEREFERCAREAASDEGDVRNGPWRGSLDAHLRFQRRINLTGLLQRLDTATMLAGVEGRAPFADIVVGALAESLPMRVKFEPTYAEAVIAGAGGGPASIYPMIAGARTKVALREGFRRSLPAEIVERPKASFPLPFPAWIGDHAGALRRSSFAREVFAPGAIDAVCENPSEMWQFAWPMINLALWGERWWG